MPANNRSSRRCRSRRESRRPVQRAVLDALGTYRRLTFPQLVHVTRINRGSVWRALNALESTGALRARPIEGRIYYELPE